MTASAPNTSNLDATNRLVDWRMGIAGLAIVVVQRMLLCAMGIWHHSSSIFKWDALWYRNIALHGYSYIPPVPGHRSTPSSLAFFPFLPIMGRAVHGVTRLGIDVSLELVSLGGLVMAVLGIAAVGTLVAGQRTALLLVALWGAAPRGLVTVMPYTEGLFTAMAAWCMYFLLRRRWWEAAVLCAVAGLTRSSAATLIITVGLAWLRVRWRELGSPRVIFQGFALALIATSGLLAYIAYVAHCTGRWDGYIAVQREWYMQMGSPLTSLQQIPRIWHIHREWWVFNYTVIPALIGLVLALAVLIARPTFPLATFAYVSTGWTWCAMNYFWCKPRFMLPVFVLGLAPARLLARSRLLTCVLTLAVLTFWSCWADMHQWSAYGAP